MRAGDMEQANKQTNKQKTNKQTNTLFYNSDKHLCLVLMYRWPSRAFDMCIILHT